MADSHHPVNLKIINNTNRQLEFRDVWFQTGCVSPDKGFPNMIARKSSVDVVCYNDEEWYTLDGTSGLANFISPWLLNEVITIAFSCPVEGDSKIGVGLDGMNVWENMQQRFGDYQYFHLKDYIWAAVKNERRIYLPSINNAEVLFYMHEP